MIRIENGPNLDDESRAMLASGRANASVSLFIDAVLAIRGLQDELGGVLAGVMLETETPAPMRADALARALATIDAPAGRIPVRAGAVYPELIRLPPRLAEAISAAEAGRGWSSLTPDIRALSLSESGSVKAEILRIPPGASAPRHTHRGREYSLCLAGGFSDGRDRYGPGDVSFGDPSVTHQPVADPDGVCFVLVITDAGLQLTGVMGLLQRLIGR